MCRLARTGPDSEGARMTTEADSIMLGMSLSQPVMGPRVSELQHSRYLLRVEL